MILPAWSYLYPARGIVSWAALPSRTRRSDATWQLAQLFGVGEDVTRRLLHDGDRRLWRLTKRDVMPFRKTRLWRAIASLSNVVEGEYVSVPDSALSSLQLTRAYLSQPVLTQGPEQPVSLEECARRLGRSQRAVSEYRRLLASKGRLEIVPVAVKVREQVLSLHAPRLVSGEYIEDGWVCQRGHDVIVIKDRQGELVSWTFKRTEVEALRGFSA